MYLNESAPSGRGSSLSNISNFAITDNPVFRVKIRTLATDFEQPANNKTQHINQDDATAKFKIGEKVTGKSKTSDKIFTGKIVKIIKNISAVIIIDDETEKKRKLDANSCKQLKKETDSGRTELPFTTENYIISLKEFLYENAL